jgi:hypothetical protein
MLLIDSDHAKFYDPEDVGIQIPRKSRLDFYVLQDVTPQLIVCFIIFSQFLQANALMIQRLGYDSFLPNPLQFIVHLSFCQSTLY